MSKSNTQHDHPSIRVPWNKGSLVGQKPPLKLMMLWRLPSTSRLNGLGRRRLTVSGLAGRDFLGWVETEARIENLLHIEPLHVAA